MKPAPAVQNNDPPSSSDDSDEEIIQPKIRELDEVERRGKIIGTIYEEEVMLFYILYYLSLT